MEKEEVDALIELAHEAGKIYAELGIEPFGEDGSELTSLTVKAFRKGLELGASRERAAASKFK